jgi:hypothetical protein
MRRSPRRPTSASGRSPEAWSSSRPPACCTGCSPMRRGVDRRPLHPAPGDERLPVCNEAWARCDCISALIGPCWRCRGLRAVSCSWCPDRIPKKRVLRQSVSFVSRPSQIDVSEHRNQSYQDAKAVSDGCSLARLPTTRFGRYVVIGHLNGRAFRRASNHRQIHLPSPTRHRRS